MITTSVLERNSTTSSSYNLMQMNMNMMEIHANEILDISYHSSTLEIEKTKNNDYTAKYQNKYLHSRYNPQDEAYKQIKYMQNKKFDSIIIFGMGLGYVPQLLKNEYPNIPVIIIEINTCMFVTLISNWDYRNYKNIALTPIFVNVHHTQIIEYLKLHGLKQPHVIVTQAYQNFFGNHDQKTMESIKQYACLTKINDNTLEKFEHQLKNNVIQNIKMKQKQIRNISQIKNIFCGIPTLLCCAGPSIEYTIPYMKKLQKRMLIVAVDTALPTLYDNGIIADMIITVDPQYINTLHLNWSVAHMDNTYIITELGVNPRILRMFEHSPIFINEPYVPLGKQIVKDLSMNNEISLGGSVATFAWESLRILGVTNIYTTGLDLSYPIPIAHNRYCIFEKNYYHKNDRLETVETLNFKGLYNTVHLKTKSFNDAYVLTDKRLMVYYSWFKNINLQYPHINTYSFCADAAAIPGFKHIHIDNVLEMHEQRTMIDHILQCNINTAKCIDTRCLDKNIYTLKHNLEDFHLCIKKVIALLNTSYSEEKIRILQQQLANHPAAEIINFFIQGHISDILTNQNNMTNKTSIYHAEKKLYDILRTCTQDIISILYKWFPNINETFSA